MASVATSVNTSQVHETQNLQRNQQINHQAHRQMSLRIRRRMMNIQITIIRLTIRQGAMIKVLMSQMTSSRNREIRVRHKASSLKSNVSWSGSSPINLRFDSSMCGQSTRMMK